MTIRIGQHQAKHSLATGSIKKEDLTNTISNFKRAFKQEKKNMKLNMKSQA
jgi:hypothetical protein